MHTGSSSQGEREDALTVSQLTCWLDEDTSLLGGACQKGSAEAVGSLAMVETLAGVKIGERAMMRRAGVHCDADEANERREEEADCLFSDAGVDEGSLA